MVIAADGTVTASDIYRAVVRNRAKLAYNGVAAWLDGTAPAPPRLAAVPGLDEQLRMQDRVAQALKTRAARARRAGLETLEVRAGVRRRRAGRSAARRKEPREGADRGLHDRGQRRHRPLSRRTKACRRCAACCGRPSAGTASSRWRRESGERLPATPDAAALDAFLTQAPSVDPERFPDLSLVVVKLLGSGEYALEVPGQPRRRPLRAGGQGLHALHRAQPPLSRSHHAAPAEGGACRAAVAYANDELADARAPLHRAGGQCGESGTAGRRSPPRRCSWRRGSARDSTLIVTGASDKGTWVRISGPTAEGRVVRGIRGTRRRRPRPRGACPHRCRAGVYRFRRSAPATVAPIGWPSAGEIWRTRRLPLSRMTAALRATRP